MQRGLPRESFEQNEVDGYRTGRPEAPSESTAVFTPRTGGVKGTQCPCAGAPAGMILDLAHALRGGVLRGVAPSRVHECRRDCQLHVKEFATFGSACRQHEELDTHHKDIQTAYK